MKIKYEDIVERARQRPVGYLEDVLASGELAGGFVQLPDSEYDRLKEKYRLEPPGLLQLLTNFAGAVSKWAASGFPVCEPWLFERRLSTCQECEHWDASGKWPRCGKCGCYKLKLWLTTEDCPEKRW